MAEEEISLVSKEILNVAKVFCERHNHLTETLARVTSKSHCKLMQGKMSLISSKIVSVEREFSLLQQSCGSIVPIIPDFQSYSQTRKTTSLRLGDVFSVVELDEMVDDANAYEAEVEVEIEENSELEKWIEQIDTSIVEPEAEGEDD
ncbi:uncharacterized protein LOC135483691 [Lineus longissimus]|uniref:uncharacterized protein LOC135483691 n=1 Tax=Lineus longissimus TaxID=88925 RepID=UPI00315C8996